MVIALTMSATVIAKPKVSKEIKAQAAQMVKDGWVYKPTAGASLEETLTAIAERREAIGNDGVIVTVTAQAQSMEMARKKAMMNANREIGLTKSTQVAGNDQTTMKITDDSTSVRTLASSDTSTQQKVGKTTVLLEATRKQGNGIEVMFIVLGE